MPFASIFSNLCLGLLAVPLGILLGIVFLKLVMSDYYPCDTVPQGLGFGAVGCGGLWFLSLVCYLFSAVADHDRDGVVSWCLLLLAWGGFFAGLTVIVACAVVRPEEPDRAKGKRRVFPTSAVPVPPPPYTPPPPPVRWYYARAGQTAGPVALEELRRLVVAGQLQPADFVIREGSQTWVPVSSVPELKSTEL